MYLNDRFVHRVDVNDGRTKNKLLPAARMSLARPGMIVSGERRLPACSRRQLADDCLCVARLPNTAGQLPALPRSARHSEPARDLLLVFFESTLHVSPDQQLSALQPLTK
jgi:hypothetical protein